MGWIRWGRRGALAAGLVILASCGGGGGGGSGPAPAPDPGPASISITGTVAVGAAIRDATVDVKCAEGAGAATTDAAGGYALTLRGPVAGPCMARVTGGSSDAPGGPPAALYSMIDSLGAGARLNVTPLTHLLAATVLGGDPAGGWADCCGVSGAAGGRITRDALAHAKGTVFGELATKLGMNDATLQDADWVGGAFVLHDAMDQRLDLLGSQLALARLDLPAAAAQLGAQRALAVTVPLAQSACIPGVIGRYDGDFSDAPFEVASVAGGPGVLPGASAAGAGVGAGAGEGRLSGVSVTVAFADGRAWRRTPAPQGRVTIVPCGYAGPALVTVEALDDAATYYDEGLGRTLPLPQGYVSRAMVPAINKGIGITPFTEAAYQYAQNLASAAAAGKSARGSGLPPAALQAMAPAIATKATASAPWTDAGIVVQANTTIGAILTDQLPALFRTTGIDPVTHQIGRLQPVDITRLPKVLDASDADRAGTLPDTDNGRHGALLAGLAHAGAVALPGSAAPALEIRRQLVADLADGRLDRLGGGGAVSDATEVAYTYSSLWSNLTAGAQRAATTAGTGTLGTTRVRVASAGRCDVPRGGYDTEYALISDGRLVEVTTSGTGTTLRVVDPTRRHAALKATGNCATTALARDGRSFTLVTTGAQRPLPAPNGRPLSVVDWDVSSWDALVFRGSDGGWWHLDASSQWAAVPAPAEVTSIALVPVLANVNAGDTALASVAGDGAIPPAFVGGGGQSAAGRLDDVVVGLAAYGLRTDGTVASWRWGTRNAPRTLAVAGVRQITTDGFGVYGLTSAGEVYWLNAQDALVKPAARAGGLVYIVPPLQAAMPTASPVRLTVPEACWIDRQYVRTCDGRVYRLQADIAWACKVAVYGTSLCALGPGYQNLASNVGMYGFTGDPLPLYLDAAGAPVETVTASPMSGIWRVADAPVPPVYGTALPPRPVFLGPDGRLAGGTAADFSGL